MDESSGNFTTKEMLVRIDAKLDSYHADMEAVKLHLAVHEAYPWHTGSDEQVKEIRSQLDGVRQAIKYGAGVVATMLLLAPVVWSFVK